jgi:hypothetical protein
VDDTTRRDAHTGVVLRAAISHIFARIVVDANQWVVGGHLGIVTVASRLRKPIQLTAEEPKETVCRFIGAVRIVAPEGDSLLILYVRTFQAARINFHGFDQ